MRSFYSLLHAAKLGPSDGRMITKSEV